MAGCRASVMLWMTMPVRLATYSTMAAAATAVEPPRCSSTTLTTTANSDPAMLTKNSDEPLKRFVCELESDVTTSSYAPPRDAENAKSAGRKVFGTAKQEPPEKRQEMKATRAGETKEKPDENKLPESRTPAREKEEKNERTDS